MHGLVLTCRSKWANCTKLCQRRLTILFFEYVRETKMQVDYERVILDTLYFHWGKITDSQIEYLLKDAPVGSFLTRECDANSSIQYNILVKITDRSIACLDVLKKGGLFCLAQDSKRYPAVAVTLYGLVEKLVAKTKKDGRACRLRSRCRTEDVKLIEPIRRMSSLKAHCRRVVRLKIFPTDIEKLDISPYYKSYLRRGLT